MKKTLLLAVIGLMSINPGAKAQEVFNQVVGNAKLILEDPKADQFLISVSQFKYTALQYLCTTAIKQNGGGVASDLLDQQAYSLNHFITSYFSELAKAQKQSKSAQKDIMKKYWKACAENPMFQGQDKEITDSFINDPSSITPFSINVDWEKADKAATEK